MALALVCRYSVLSIIMQATAKPTPTHPHTPPRKTWRAVLATALLLVGLLLVLASGLWVWLGSSHSLSTTTTLLSRWVPGLSIGPATGSVRHGGHIDSLSWNANGTRVQASDIEGTWQAQTLWAALLDSASDSTVEPTDGQANAQAPSQMQAASPAPVATRAKASVSANVRIAQLTIDVSDADTRDNPPDNAPDGATTTVLPRSVSLPVAIDLSLDIADIALKQGTTTQHIHALQAAYSYGGHEQPHELVVGHLQYGKLQASAQASLSSTGAWPLRATATINTPASALAEQLATQALSASVSVQGHLASATTQAYDTAAGGATATDTSTNTNNAPPRLVLQATASGNKRNLLEAEVTLNPWATQPVQQARLVLSQLNLANWLPASHAALTTDLSGTVTVSPTADGNWLGNIQLSQSATTPWPAAQLSAHVTWSDSSISANAIDLRVLQDQHVQAWLRGDATFNTATNHVRLALQGQAPGVSAATTLRMDMQHQLMPVGDVQLDLSDAAQLTRWLQTTTQGNPLFATIETAPQGQLDLNASFAPNEQVAVTVQAKQLVIPWRGTSVRIGSATLALSNTWQNLLLDLSVDAQAPGLIDGITLHTSAQVDARGLARANLIWRDVMWQLQLRERDQRTWNARSTLPWAGQLQDGKASGNASGLSIGLANCTTANCAALLSWQAWRASADGITTAGRVDNLNVALLQALWPQLASASQHTTPWRSNLVVGASFRANFGPKLTPDVLLRLDKTSGDIELFASEDRAWHTLGLTALSAQARWQDRALTAQATLDSRLAGRIGATVSTTLTASGWGVMDTPDAPLKGHVDVALQDLAWLGPWLPARLQVGGTLNAQLDLGGTHHMPRPSGTIAGHKLFVRHAQGDFDVGGGELKAQLDAKGINVQRLYVHGVTNSTQGGYANASGRLDWTDSADAGARLALQLVQFQPASKADRRIRISGDLNSQWRNARLGVNGQLRIDKADITLGALGAPTLGDDVVIVGRPVPVPPKALPLDLNIDLSLGEAFKVSGFGLITGLRGNVLISGPDANNQPILHGEVNTVEARYKAYGQDLQVQRGRLVFAGSPDAPVLDILAVRALTEPQVGVQVQGPLRAPKVTLYASVPMADSEKLSWLLLGHPSARAGSEAALIQNAVLALAGNTNTLIAGLDELSIEGETRLSDGTTRAAQLTVGKQLGERLYTTYTRSVASLQGLLSVYLKLSNSLALRAQAGESNNIDLVWSRAYD
jgi:translocation and assembly module TamB